MNARALNMVYYPPSGACPAFNDKLYTEGRRILYKYTCLNPIAEVGLGKLDDNYARTEDFASADAVFVRSAKMDELTPGPNLLPVSTIAQRPGCRKKGRKSCT